ESAAPRGRVRRESLVARRQGVGVASHPQARGAAPLAGGPGGEPGGCGRQRPVCGRRGRGGAGARGRTAGRGAGGRPSRGRVGGEAARVHGIAQRGGVPVAAALSSVVWTRVAEALALALFLVMAPSVLALESWLRALQVGVGLTLGIVLLLAWARGWAWLADQLPDSLQSRLAVLRTMGRGGRLLWPTALALYNWAGQWATYHRGLRASHVPVSLAASFTALIAANLSGLLRPTPAHVGVTQAALVVGLLPFGLAPEQ